MQGNGEGVAVGLFGFISGQFIDVIEWLDSTNETMVYRFERAGNEIKQGAKLIVRPGQVAVFVNEGHVADVFDAGTHELYTRNLPILSTLQAWPYGFNSPFKAEVYFFSTRAFTNLKWGTSNPITLRDPEFGPVRLRAFGSYAMRVVDPKTMLEKLVSTDGLFQVDEISNQIRNILVSGFATWIGRSGIPVLDLAGQYEQLSDTIRQALQGSIREYGLELSQMLIENISLPPEVEKVLDKRTSMGILGNLQDYTQFQAAQAIEASAQNPGGGNPGMDFGVGMAMGQQLINAMQPAASPAAPSAPAGPPPLPAQWYVSQSGQSQGPLTLDQVRQQSMTADTMVWRAGMANWMRAGEVPELASRLHSQPEWWYVGADQQRQGPFTLAQLVQQGIQSSTYLWRQGMENWVPAQQVPEVASQIASGPPPLPPLP
ncbi:MAG: SPFH domain-containing protein [Synechococcaceae cyanobacterium SM2_3_1]|nr:SPFH domain-containing protein [Synechococcaceae cyanobacterium SM2_3_1]